MSGRAPKWLGAGASALVLAVAGALATHFEGTRATAYQDPVGVWTICAGHTGAVRAGQTATAEDCRAYLQQDMGAAYAAVQRCITTPMTIGQQAAFTDAAFNLGPSVVCGSTLQRLANAGDVEGACMQLVDAKGSDGLPTGYTKAGGKVLNGLLARREAEVQLCIGGLQ